MEPRRKERGFRNGGIFTKTPPAPLGQVEKGTTSLEDRTKRSLRWNRLLTTEKKNGREKLKERLLLSKIEKVQLKSYCEENPLEKDTVGLRKWRSSSSISKARFFSSIRRYDDLIAGRGKKNPSPRRCPMTKCVLRPCFRFFIGVAHRLTFFIEVATSIQSRLH